MRFIVFAILFGILALMRQTESASVAKKSCWEKYPFARHCALYCQFGYKYDEDGCFMCQCLPSPFADLFKENGPLGY